MNYGDLKILFEVTMVICFGLGWPMSIAKSLRTRFVKGKSMMFMSIVLTGYAAGFASKIFFAQAESTSLPWVSWLYLLNFCMVSTDLILYFKFRHNQEAITDTLAQEISAMADEEAHEHPASDA